ncbi:MAG TPA: heparinase II/III family protein, partial [Opitutaceae bacterium]|nr:heparinase II/III family protein [Opitutaceae bacterium]
HHHPPVAAPAESPASGRLFPPQPGRLLSGFGLSLLNNPADTVGLSLYHGLHLNHRHFDRLHFDVFARGQAMMPDLGYPDAMNAMVPGIYTWSLATISHNTVTVDAAMQPGNEAGVVELQAEGGWVRAVTVNAPGTYPQCPVYRRTLVMVDAGSDRSYVVDFFDVTGGRQHDYSLHGPPGEFALSGDWTVPAPGTLAGPDVPVGALYDDLALASPDNKEGYAGYRGSGFQHLEKVRRHRGGEWAADYTHERDPAAQLRLRVLPQPDQELMLAEARVSPVKWPQILRYVIARRHGAAGLTSRFVSVVEPHAGTPFLRGAERHEAGGDTMVVVTHQDGCTDVILHGTPGTEHRWEVAGHAVVTDARVSVVTLDPDGAARRLWFADGKQLTLDGVVHRASALIGRVQAVDLANATVRVAPDAPVSPETAATLAGRIVHFGPERTTANSIASARVEAGELILTLRDDVITGCVRLRAVAPGRLDTASRLMLAATYAGHGLRNAAGRFVGRVRAAGDDWIEPAAPLAAGDLSPGEDVLVTLTSPGDRCEFPAVAAWRR